MGIVEMPSSSGSTSAARFHRRGGGVTVSSVVCTRDRTAQLRQALASLSAQRVAPREILVVDNAPRDEATRNLIIREFPCVRYVREPVPGLDVARNRALIEAKGEIVAFMDDDAVADPAWIDFVGRAFDANPELGVCTGRIMPLHLGTDGQRLFEANGGLFAAGADRILLPARDGASWRRWIPNIAWAISMGSGCNLAVRRSLALSLGGFDEVLDRGPALPGGGDNDMVWRVLESGAQAMYEPAAAVRHHHRESRNDALSQIVGHQRAAMALLTKAAIYTGGLRRLPVLLFLFWRLLKPGLRIGRRLVGRDPLPLSTLTRIWIACLRGLGTYPRAMRSERHRKQERYQAANS